MRTPNTGIKVFLRILAVIYFVGAVLHGMDLFDLRLKFSEMDLTWQTWILYLFAFDLVASIGLWKQKAWGVALFLLISISQLIAYVGFASKFGNQLPLVIFHFLTIAIFLALSLTQKKIEA